LDGYASCEQGGQEDRLVTGERRFPFVRAQLH
jgi:hypothetical protein